MKFGFHSYHESFFDRLSLHKGIYLMIFMLFTTALVSIGTYAIRPQFNSFAKDNTIQPLPENYSAPLGDSIRTPRKPKKVIGFLPSWSIASDAKIYPEYMDQILYFGIPIDKNGTLVKTDDSGKPIPDWSYLNSEKFKEIRARAKKTNTKILVTIKNFDNESIKVLVGDPVSAKEAVKQINELITTYDLDGIDLNFEYFSRGKYPLMVDLNTFLTDLRTTIKKDHPNAILSFDVNATVIYQDNAYDMVKIGELMDQVIIMGYDYSRQESTLSGPVAPLYSSGNEPSVSRSVASVLGRVPKEKVLLGIPLYGYEWQTYTTEYNSDTVPHTGAVATYQRIRDLISNRNDVSISYGDISKSPWLIYKQNGLIKQIHYEDERSIAQKIDYVYDKDIAGIALWALGYEGEYIEPWNVIVKQMK